MLKCLQGYISARNGAITKPKAVLKSRRSKGQHWILWFWWNAQKWWFLRVIVKKLPLWYRWFWLAPYESEKIHFFDIFPIKSLQGKTFSHWSCPLELCGHFHATCTRIPHKLTLWHLVLACGDFSNQKGAKITMFVSPPISAHTLSTEKMLGKDFVLQSELHTMDPHMMGMWSIFDHEKWFQRCPMILPQNPLPSYFGFFTVTKSATTQALATLLGSHFVHFTPSNDGKSLPKLQGHLSLP